MTYLVGMTPKEYFLFRLYVCKVKGFDTEQQVKEGRQLRGQKAEEWLLSTGKIKIRTVIDSRGHTHPYAYLVIRGDKEKLDDILEVCYTRNIYENTIGKGTKGETTLLRRDAKRTIMYCA